MITPRRTRLVRVPDLRAFHRAIRLCMPGGDRAACVNGAVAEPLADSFAAVVDTRQTAILVSTHAAAAELRATLENALLLGDDCGACTGVRMPAVVWPDILTRDGWYERLHDGTPGMPRLLGAIEREVMLGRATRAAIAAGHVPPFRVRPALVAEMLVLLDTVLRLGRTLDAFERLLVSQLEPQADMDRGAERLLRQTRFLVFAFREYQRLVAESRVLDEHGLRQRLLAVDAPEPAPTPAPCVFTRVVVTVGDRLCGPGGLWPVDFDLLTRLPGLERIDVVATESVLAAGFHERLQDLLPGFDEADVAAEGRAPTLMTPPGGEERWWVSRDREEEIATIARRIKRDHLAASESSDAPHAAAAPLDRTAIVCKRPLPYVYLAQAHLGGAGVPFQAFDELPLAAEPFAAALDLVFRFVESGFARRTAIALMLSPHFTCRQANGSDVPREAVLALDEAWRGIGEAAGIDVLDRIIEPGSGPGAGARARLAAEGARVAAAIRHELEPLGERRPMSEQCATVLAFLDAHARVDPTAPAAARTARARGAILGALRELRFAHLAHDDAPTTLRDLVSRVRRWIEGQTFSPRTGRDGLHLVDADAARYGDFDEVHLVGLIEREWPDKAPGTIFYPPSLLTQIGWPAERLRLAASRAAFKDLVRLPARTLSVSTFVLEDDAIVEPSPLLDDLERSGLTETTGDLARDLRVLPEEGLVLDPPCLDPLDDAARAWADLRMGRTSPDAPAFHGSIGQTTLGPQAVRRIEMYLDCPFKYFAEAVLKLKDESDDDPSEGPRADGRFLHEVLAAFYEQWQASGGRVISTDTLDAARAMFADVVEGRLAALRPASRELWRVRLLGSGARSGIGEMALRFEAAHAEPIVDRLLEHRLDGPVAIAAGSASRTLTLRGVADRIDVLDGRRLRIIDYKLGRAPNVQRAIQLPVYGVQARQHLGAADAASWSFADLGYLAFGTRDPYVSIASGGRGVDQAVVEGQQRVLDAVEGIEQGQFPPKPAEPFACTYCAYARVCRKDYVDGT